MTGSSSSGTKALRVPRTNSAGPVKRRQRVVAVAVTVVVVVVNIVGSRTCDDGNDDDGKGRLASAPLSSLAPAAGPLTPSSEAGRLLLLLLLLLLSSRWLWLWLWWW